MTIREALDICDKFRKNNGNYDEDSLFVYTEALKYLIDETMDPEYMFELGGAYYYEMKYDLALKYYGMTVEYVKNMDKNNTGNVSGLLLYAKTEEGVFPDGEPFKTAVNADVIITHSITSVILLLQAELQVLQR